MGRDAAFRAGRLGCAASLAAQAERDPPDREGPPNASHPRKLTTLTTTNAGRSTSQCPGSHWGCLIAAEAASEWPFATALERQEQSLELMLTVLRQRFGDLVKAIDE